MKTDHAAKADVSLQLKFPRKLISKRQICRCVLRRRAAERRQ